MSSEKPKTKFKICRTIKEVKDLIGYVKQTKIASIDFETSGSFYWKQSEYPTIIGISFQPGSCYIVPLGHFDSPFKNRFIPILQMLSREIFQNTDILKVAWNVKFEWKWLLKYGCSLQGRVYDAMLAKYLLDENSLNGLKENVAYIMPEHAGYDDEIDELLKRNGGKEKGWSKIPLDKLSQYCSMDCDLTLRLMMVYHPILIKKNLYQLFRNMLMMATRVLTESEFHGFKVDRPYLEETIEKYKALIEDKRASMYRIKSIRKFVRRTKKDHIQNLINNAKKEIAQIIKDDKPSKDRTIKFRQDKILRFLSGNLKGKKEIYEGINLASPKQLSNLLYISKHGFELPIIKYTKDKNTKQFTDNPSTDEASLTEYLEGARKKDSKGKPYGDIIKLNSRQKEFIQFLLDLRGLEKLYSTYMVGILEKLDEDDIIHCDYHLLTVTGRLGCREPNMQNVPRVTTNPDVKPMFIPWLGTLIGEVDYSQAELRVVAEVADDKVMIDIFKRGFNIHVATAALNNGGIEMYDRAKALIKKADSLTPEQLRLAENTEIFKWVKEKKRAKTINFGILYGEGAPKLALELGCSVQEAEAYITRWLDNYPGVKRWIKKQHAFVKKHGYVKTIWGRKRRLEDVWGDHYGKYLEALRQSVNAPIQSAASDFTLFSTIIIMEQRLMGKLPSYLIQLYTVHDSIGYPFKAPDIKELVPKIVKICDNPDTMKWFNFQMKKVAMKVSPEVGKNWGSLKDYSEGFDYSQWLKN